MNPTLPEEAGQTARGLIDALKAQPAVLALTVANMALLVFIYFALHAGAEFRNKMLDQLLNNGATIQSMLKACSDARTN
jgi:hypothetical protein